MVQTCSCANCKHAAAKYKDFKNSKFRFNNHKKTYNKSVNVITETFDDDEFREEVTCPCTVADEDNMVSEAEEEEEYSKEVAEVFNFKLILRNYQMTMKVKFQFQMILLLQICPWLIRTLAIPNAKILLDTGAAVNIIFSDTLLDLPPTVVVIGKFLSKRTYHVVPAFGASTKCNHIVKLQISFPYAGCYPFPFIIDYFLILPIKGTSKVIFGKPLLSKLKYKKTSDVDYLTVKDAKISFPNIQSDDLKILQVEISNDPNETYIKKYPLLFSDSISAIPKHNFKYKVILKDFDYHKPSPFYAKTIHSKAIKDFLSDAMTNKVISPVKTEELIALAPIFPTSQKDKIRVVTDFRQINKSLQFGNSLIPPISLII